MAVRAIEYSSTKDEIHFWPVMTFRTKRCFRASVQKRGSAAAKNTLRTLYETLPKGLKGHLPLACCDQN